MRTMYDGINSLAAGIYQHFPSPEMVAGYIDGHFAWTQAEWNLFPHAIHIQVAVLASTNAGDVIDCETGDATPAQAASWVRMRKAAGYYRPTIYCSRSVIPAVRTATGSLALGRDYDIWVADYTNQPHQVTGCAATQYQNTSGWDVTAVYDGGWPHRSAPVPPPAPKPPVQPVPQTQPQEEQDMIILRAKLDGKTVTTWTYDGTSVKHIVSVADQNALGTVLKVVDVTAAQLVKFNGGVTPAV